MIVYCVTKNAPEQMVYLGTSIKDAEESVGLFRKYQLPESRFPKSYPASYTLVPKEVEPMIIRFYATDGWWYSIVMFELNKETK